MQSYQRLLLLACVLLSILSASALIPKRKTNPHKLRDSTTPGLRVTAGESGFSYVANQVVPILLNRIRNLALPTTISGEKYDFDYHVDSLVLKSVSYSNAAISLVNTGTLTVNGVSVQVTGNWGYKLDSWPHWPSGSGGVTVSVSDLTIVVQAAPVVNSDGSLSLSVSNVIVNINSVSISCSGSPFDWLYNLIADAAKGAVKDAISNAVRNALMTMVPQYANQILATIPVRQAVAGGLFIDTRFTGSQYAAAHPGWVSLGAIGSFETATSAPSTLPHAQLPAQSAPSTFVAVDIDAYVFNSLFQLETLPVFKVYDQDPQVPLNLNTATFKALLPALYTAFPDYTIMFQLVQTSPFSVSITPQQPLLDAQFNWTWYVSNDKNPDPKSKVYQPAFVLATDVDLSGALSFNLTAVPPTVTLTGAVTNISATLLSSTFGPFPTGPLQAFLSAIVKGVADKLLVRSFPIPTIAGLSLQSPSITYGTNYATALLSFTYSPPSSLAASLDELVLPMELVGLDDDALDTVDTR